ncbi:hypothetical protein [Nostoc sp. ChiQUE01b]|nr:hypothetical protein [Nostoc sp. ChiQUE01b]MDZ8258334.1 hypothetical protein [Nostoc sp. ChiQUE01b]
MESREQYGSVKEIYPLRQAGGAGDAGEAGGEKKAYLNRIGVEKGIICEP